jgi:hypothetical protein
LALLTYLITTFTANKIIGDTFSGCQGTSTNEIYFGTIELGTIIKPFSLMIRLYATFWQDVVLMSIIGLTSSKAGLEVLCHWVGICTFYTSNGCFYKRIFHNVICTLFFGAGKRASSTKLTIKLL